jgi:hypothetical protein
MLDHMDKKTIEEALKILTREIKLKDDRECEGFLKDVPDTGKMGEKVACLANNSRISCSASQNVKATQNSRMKGTDSQPNDQTHPMTSQ